MAISAFNHRTPVHSSNNEWTTYPGIFPTVYCIPPQGSTFEGFRQDYNGSAIYIGKSGNVCNCTYSGATCGSSPPATQKLRGSVYLGTRPGKPPPASQAFVSHSGPKERRALCSVNRALVQSLHTCFRMLRVTPSKNKKEEYWPCPKMVKWESRRSIFSLRRGKYHHLT
jgi:hypothetical protein